MSNGDTALLEYIGSFVGSIVIVSFLAWTTLVLLGEATLVGLTQSWFVLVTLLVLFASAQVFGPDTIRTIKKFRSE